MWTENKPNTPAGWKPAEKAFAMLRSPVQNWMFDVKFYLSDSLKNNYANGVFASANNLDVLLSDDSYRCIHTELPKMQGALVEKNFFGTKKSFVISRDYSGEVTMEFWIRAKSANDGEIEVDLLDLIVPPNDQAAANGFSHYEFIDTFDTIEIEQFNPDGSHFRTYRLYHPQITSVDTGGDLSYDGEEGMKMSIVVHYDYWEHD